MRRTRYTGLLPTTAAVVEATPAMWETGLLPAEFRYVQSCIDRRRREFTAGRNCARAALQQLGLGASPILVGPAREPQFQVGVSGSITHTQNYCAAAVLRSDAGTGIGIDAEIEWSPHDEIWPLTMGEDENAQLESLKRHGTHGWEQLFFSAKEAFYKATFPIHRRFIDFHDITVEVQPRDQVFTVSVVTPSLRASLGSRTFTGRYRFEASLVFTAIIVD